MIWAPQQSLKFWHRSSLGLIVAKDEFEPYYNGPLIVRLSSLPPLVIDNIAHAKKKILRREVLVN